MKEDIMKKSITFYPLLIVTLLFMLPVAGFSNGGIQGIIHYSGSATGPVIIAAVNFQLNFDELLLLDTLATGPGPFELTDLEPGTYIVAAFLDANENGLPGLDEPMGAYGGTLTVNPGEVTDSVDIYIKELPRGSATINGTVSYGGAQTGTIHLFVVGPTGTPFNQTHVASPGGSFSVSGLMAGTYVVAAYLDANGNDIPDLGEPIGFNPEPVPIKNSDIIDLPDITLYDAAIFSGSISGTIDYTPIGEDTIYIYTVGLSHTPVTITTLASPQTQFTVNNLAGGKYYMFAFLDSSHNQIYDPMKIDIKNLTIQEGEPYELIAEPIIVNDGEMTQQDLILAPTGDAGISGTVSYSGSQTGLPIVLAIGLSPSWLGLAPAFTQPYIIPNLDAGYYAVIGAMLPFSEDAEIDLNMPIGFYTKELVHVTAHDTITGIDFVLQDSTTATSSIAGTITVPDNLSGDVHVFCLGLSLTPFSSQVINGNTFNISGLRMGRYLTAAFLDVNGNGNFDIEEPFAITEKLLEIPDGGLELPVNLKLKVQELTRLEPASPIASSDQFVLGQNYPNPFNPETRIEYNLPVKAPVTVKIYNMLGREIRALVNQVQSAGMHTVHWDGMTADGYEAPSGIYLYCLKSGNYLEFKRMTLLR